VDGFILQQTENSDGVLFFNTVENYDFN